MSCKYNEIIDGVKGLFIELQGNAGIIFLVIMCLYVAGLAYKYYFLKCYSSDKKAQKILSRFYLYKFFLYLVFIIVSVGEYVIYKTDLSPSIFIALFLACVDLMDALSEAISIKVHIKSELAKEKIDKLEKKEMDEYGNRREALRTYANELLDMLDDDHKVDYIIQPIYEQLHDYFKYYACVNTFFDLLKKYEHDSSITKEKLKDELRTCISGMDYVDKTIIKVPDGYEHYSDRQYFIDDSEYKKL